MRVIRVEPPPAAGGTRTPMVAAGLLAVGIMAIMLIGLAFELLPSAGTLALIATAALGTGVGISLTLRVIGRDPARKREAALAALLAPAFDDSYILVLAPAGCSPRPGGTACRASRRASAHRSRLAGPLPSPRPPWQYDTRGPRGWITCRTNPTIEANMLRDAIARWASDADVDPDLPIAPAVVFPHSHSNVVLEEPDTEVVTTDNAPWWAQPIGRVQRMDAVRIAHFVEAVVSASRASATDRRVAARPRGAA